MKNSPSEWRQSMSVKSHRKANKTKPLILGHRGYSKFYPENTELSFAKAFKFGADGIEFDVQRTGDGNFVIFHDYEMERLTGVRGNLFGLKNGLHRLLKVHGREEIPELKEFLSKAPKGRIYNMELKEETLSTEDCHHILESIDDLEIRNNLIISSFNPELLPFFKKRGFQTGLLFHKKERFGGFVKFIFNILRVRPHYLNLPIDFFAEKTPFTIYLILKSLRLPGFKIIFWTVNRRRDYLKVHSYSDFIITDEVEKMKSLREQYI